MGPGQEIVEVFDLPAFTFPADPGLLALGPNARPVKQKKPAAWIVGIQTGDAIARNLEQSGIARGGHFRGICKIREQCVGKIRLGVGEKAHFQLADFSLDHRFARKHHRHHDQCGRSAGIPSL